MSQLIVVDAFGVRERTGSPFPLDDRNREIVAAALKLYWEPSRYAAYPQVGDFVLTDPASRRLARIAYVHPDSIQVARGGSFHLCRDGTASYSGGLLPADRRPLQLLPYDARPGLFWIFHHNLAGAGRGVEFEADRRVWRVAQSSANAMKAA